MNKGDRVMTSNKVNRFTFDKHSVVLFSALVLAGASSAGTNAARTGAAQANLSAPVAQTVSVAAAAALPQRLGQAGTRRAD